jgi:hypothetical protein
VSELERFVYNWGLLLTAYWPPARWRWEKEWDHWRRYR